jgi:hypothetical protein
MEDSEGLTPDEKQFLRDHQLDFVDRFGGLLDPSRIIEMPEGEISAGERQEWERYLRRRESVMLATMTDKQILLLGTSRTS